jgi:uncharacterized protein (DUF2132 family)
MSAQKQSALISYWPFGGGITRIQTRHPSIAKELRRLTNTRQVGEAVVGGYLILFDSTQRAAKLRRTLNRIERRFSGAFLPKNNSPISPAIAFKKNASITTARKAA